MQSSYPMVAFEYRQRRPEQYPHQYSWTVGEQISEEHAIDHANALAEQSATSINWYYI